MKDKKIGRKIRHIRVKKKLDSKNPRLVVTRSNKFIYAQIVDDTKGATLASTSDLAMRLENKQSFSANKQSFSTNKQSFSTNKQSFSTNKSKLERAKEVGANLAKLAIKKNIKKVVFDRAGYKYHGRIKALAQSARTGGLEF